MSQYRTSGEFLRFLKKIESLGFNMTKAWDGFAQRMEHTGFDELGADSLIMYTVKLTYQSNRRYPALEARIAKRDSDLQYFASRLRQEKAQSNPACKAAYVWAMRRLGYSV